MRGRTAALLLVALGAALLVPTAAAPIQAPWEDPISEDLVLQPTGEPDSQYVVRGADGELAVVVGPETLDGQAEGLNQRGDYRFDRMFAIVNTGDEQGVVWLTDDTDRVQFYRGAGTDDSFEGRTNNVTLEPGESVEVGMSVDTGDEDISSSFTVHAVGSEETPDSGTEPLTVGGGTASVQEEDGETTESGDGSGSSSRDSTPTPTPTPTATARANTPTDATTATASPTSTPVTSLISGFSPLWFVLLAGAVLIVLVAIARSRDKL